MVCQIGFNIKIAHLIAGSECNMHFRFRVDYICRENENTAMVELTSK